jgi:hypothetical protein
MVEDAELKSLDAAIVEALAKRNQYVHLNAEKLSEFKVGDRIYAEIAADGYKLRPAGVVTEIYIPYYGDGQKAQVEVKFSPAPGYHYGGETKSNGFSYFYPESRWVEHLKREKARFDRELNAAGVK